MVVVRNRPTRRARELRNPATDAERKLWTFISRRQVAGAEFSRRIPVGPFICDFVNPSARPVIDLDGGQHDENEGRDRQRTAYIEGMGVKLVRFWNDEARDNIEVIVSRIAYQLPNTAPPAPPTSGRGGS